MMPVIRDQCGYSYYREWSGGIAAGGFEPRCKPCFHEGIPKPYEFMLMQEDWDHFRKCSCILQTHDNVFSPEVLMEQMLVRIPALEHVEIRQLLNGAECFTPDIKPVLGEAPNVSNKIFYHENFHVYPTNRLWYSSIIFVYNLSRSRYCAFCTSAKREIYTFFLVVTLKVCT